MRKILLLLILYTSVVFSDELTIDDRYNQLIRYCTVATNMDTLEKYKLKEITIQQKKEAQNNCAKETINYIVNNNDNPKAFNSDQIDFKYFRGCVIIHHLTTQNKEVKKAFKIKYEDLTIQQSNELENWRNRIQKSCNNEITYNFTALAEYDKTLGKKPYSESSGYTNKTIESQIL